MKNLFVFVPLALFFTAYTLGDIYIATIVLMVSTTVMLGIERLTTGTVSKMHFYITVLLLILGTITVALRDPRFIQWKVSIIHWIFGLILLASQLRGKTPTVQAFVEMAVAEQATGDEDEDGQQQLNLSGSQWRGLNAAWAAYFVGIGFLNLYIAFNFPEEIWVKFKVFGILVLQLIFMVITMTWMFRAAGPAAAPQESGDE